jgi:hypothetical protein
MAMRDIAEERQRRRRPRAAANPKGAWGLRPHASLLVVIDGTASIPPRASPGTRKPHARGPCQYSDRLQSGVFRNAPIPAHESVIDHDVVIVAPSA